MLAEAAPRLLRRHLERRPVVGSAGGDHHVVDRRWEILEERLQGAGIVGVEGRGALGADVERGLLEALGITAGEDHHTYGLSSRARTSEERPSCQRVPP